ncbi:MAG: NAD-dependent epimerase/dehydratase family protein [Thermodesulfobacteriota bacterium]
MIAILTGGTGFIGKNLVSSLIARGYKVRCLVRSTSRVEALISLGVELHYGDLSDLRTLKEITKGGDVVYHLAAVVSDWGSKEEFYRVNVEGTENLLKASVENGVKRFVFLSASSVLWNYNLWKIHDLDNVDESYPYPASSKDLYNETKAGAEKIVSEYSSETGLETVILRSSAVWGPGDTVILPRVVRAAKNGILIFVGKGDKWVTPCYVENLVEGLMLAGEKENVAGNIYFINDGIRIDNRHFISLLLKTVGIDWSPGISIPYSFAYGIASMIELGYKIVRSNKPPFLTKFAVASLAGSRTYSIEKAKRQLGYHPNINLEEGLRRLEEWVKSIGGIEGFLVVQR